MSDLASGNGDATGAGGQIRTADTAIFSRPRYVRHRPLVSIIISEAGTFKRFPSASVRPRAPVLASVIGAPHTFGRRRRYFSTAMRMTADRGIVSCLDSSSTFFNSSSGKVIVTLTLRLFLGMSP